MVKNLIQEKNKQLTNAMTYGHITNLLNSILKKDFKSIYSICPRTVKRYAYGDYLPTKPDIINALAKLCKVSPNELMDNLRAYRKQTRSTV